MADPRTYRKYQVYFFLYLAVICELLIIIVERDEAETQLRIERDELLALTQKIVMELMETHPVQSLNGSNQMEVGETRRFVIMLQGMGPQDDVTAPPRITVSRNNQVIQTLTVGREIQAVDGESHNGKRVFAFDWRAPAPGEYTFAGTSSINRLGILPTGDVKIASLTFPSQLIAALVPDLPQRINDFEQLVADLRVKVIAAGDALALNSGSVVTAVGYPATRLIEVQGTAAGRVSARATAGSVALRDGQLYWTGSFDAPGEREVTVTARDSRNAGALSSAVTTFRVDAKWPVSPSKTHEAFAGELFRKDISVAGLSNRTLYRWTATLDGRPVAEGRGHMAEFTLDEAAAGRTLVLSAEYDGQPYPVALDDRNLGGSRFTYPVLDAPARIRGLSFSRGGEYAIGQEFRFDAYVCGSCGDGNKRPPDRITVEVESDNGRDLLHDMVQEPVRDAAGRLIGYRVKFWLKGKVSREGEDALITLRADEAVEKIPVVIFAE